MKKTLLVVLAFTFVSSLCFAQQPTAPVSQAAPKSVETKSFVGKIDTIILADAVKGTHSAIAVVDEKGQKMNFTVKISTVISAKDGKKLTFSELKKDNKVIVEYITTEKGTNRAQSIKLV
ncbi:MAG: hypothetical protein ABSE81_06980 [Candidatus Omnitrophota bacterium]|jgi:Cu/Ag efflux protein CusF